MLSTAIERSTALETIPHLTTRDATVLGLESQLLGAHAEDPQHPRRHGRPARGRRLPGVERCLRGGRDRAHPADLPPQPRRGLQRPRDRRRHVVLHRRRVNPTADDLDVEVERFRRKLDAGADFAMTQIIFDLELLDQFFERFGGPRRSPCSSASSPCGATHSRCACTTRCRGSSSRITCRKRYRRRARRAKGRDGAGARARRGLTEPRRASTSSRSSGDRSGSSSFADRRPSPTRRVPVETRPRAPAEPCDEVGGTA